MQDDQMRERDQELDRFWDAIVRGDHVSTAHPLDLAMTAHVRDLHGLAHAPTPAGARERVRRGLFATTDPNRNGKEPPMNTANARSLIVIPPGPLTSPGRAEPRRPRCHPMASPFQAAVALVLIAALIGGYVAFGSGRGGRSGRPAAIPAAFSAPGPATPPVEEGVLLTVTLPADLFTPGVTNSARRPGRPGVGGAGLAHFTVPVGSQATWTPVCCPGPLIELILSGRYRVRARAAIQVVRAGGTVEAVAAETEATLGPGDAWTARNDVGADIANVGTVPVELLSWVLTDDPAFGGHSLKGWIGGQADVQSTVPVVSRPVVVQVRTSAPSHSGVSKSGKLRFTVVAPPIASATPAATPGPDRTRYYLTADWPDRSAASPTAAATP